VLGGTTYIGSGVASTAQADALTAYNNLAGLAPTQVLTGQNLGGLTLTPGVYFFALTASLTGALTLDFLGLNNADIVFQIGSTLGTSSGSAVNVIHQGLNDNVYYQVGSSATLGTYSRFQGDLIAAASVTVDTGATVPCGSLIALTGAVTLDSNIINNCSSTGSDVTPVSTASPVPEPATLGMVVAGFLTAGVAVRRRFAGE